MQLNEEDILFIKQAITTAGDIALQYQQKGLQVNRKLDKSIVTQADLAVQNFLIKILSEKYTNANFIYEEEFDLKTNPLLESELTFIIDPIDGTAMFSMEMPIWCISVGIFSGTLPLYGFIYAPVAGIFCYNDNDHAYYNDTITTIDSNLKIDSETNLFSSSEIQKEYFVSYKGKCRNLGSTALQSVLIINNRINRTLAFIGNSCLWDWAGSLPVILKAGGKVRYLNGDDFDIEKVIANNYVLPDHLITYAINDFAFVQDIFKKIPEDWVK